MKKEIKIKIKWLRGYYLEKRNRKKERKKKPKTDRTEPVNRLSELDIGIAALSVFAETANCFSTP